MRRSCLAAVCVLALPTPAAACATSWIEGGPPVSIADESAIIVWDEATQREQFIRRASFVTAANDFGFLVPTPSKPELGEVTDSAFQQLEEHTKPQVVHETKPGFPYPTISCLSLLMLTRGGAAPSEVHVLEAKRVAGYDAVVLLADDADALARWLKKDGYSTRPALASWLEPYVAAKWVLTAFKIAKDAEAPTVATSAVRMTFDTDRPFYPYREPADARVADERSRLLRVFFIGTQRVEGTIGPDELPWPGRARWSDRLVLSIPEVPAPANAWLTMFEDRASPRPGTDDLFFATARDRTPVRPAPIVLTRRDPIPIPMDILGVVGLGVWLVVRRVARGREGAA